MSWKGKYNVSVRVLESRGVCEAHKAGDLYVIPSETLSRDKPTMAPICPVAFNAIFPKIYAMEWGAKFPCHGDTFVACCPDFKNLVVFEIKRTIKK